MTMPEFEFEATKEDLEDLREWLANRPYLLQDYDDQFLRAIIRGCKRRLEKAKSVIEMGNSLGIDFPEYFGSYDPLHPPLQEFLSTVCIFPLPKKTPEGCTVIFACLNSKFNDPFKSHLLEASRYLLFTGLVLIWEDMYGSGQIKFIMDVKGGSLAHARDFTPVAVKKLMHIAESAQVFRVHSAAVFNLPYFLEYFLSLFKLLCKTKMADRLFGYSTVDKLTDYIPQKMLPKEYGGDEDSIFVLHDNWKKKVESYRQRLLEKEAKMRKLDPIRPKPVSENGMAGIFGKLNVFAYRPSW